MNAEMLTLLMTGTPSSSAKIENVSMGVKLYRITSIFTVATRLVPRRLRVTRLNVLPESGHGPDYPVPLYAMRALLRGTEILKSSCCRASNLWCSPPAIWRRGLHISASPADALDILPSEPVPSTSGAIPGLFKIQQFNCVLMVIEMPNSRSLVPRFLCSPSLSQPLKISTLGKVHWSE